MLLVLVGPTAREVGAAPDLPQSAKSLLPPAPVVRGRSGVVVSAHPEASKAGLELLERGGNAMDAAVATAFALAVVEPFSSGVGGGGFLLFHDGVRGTTKVVDYREVAPRKARPDLFVKNGKVDPKLSTQGYLAVAVPGMVPGLAKALKRFGTRRLSDVLRPAIELAEKGFAVTPQLFEATHSRLAALRANPEAMRIFLKDGGPYPVGERFRQPDLARTLRALAHQGPELFTSGSVAKAIASASERAGGLIALDDLKRVEARFRDPLVGEYRGHTIVTMPPPSSGGALLLQILGMLELDRSRSGRPQNKGGDFGPTADSFHMLIEIMRRAFADRATFFGDPAFVEAPLSALVSRAYLEERLRTIDPAHASPSSRVSAGRPDGREVPRILRRDAIPKESPDTTHLVVIDRRGNVVSLTQTINTVFGACVVAPETGVLLNNEMDDFSSAPGEPNAFGLVGHEANEIRPGKIPLSSMTPTLVMKNGRVLLALGSPGGPTIITTVAQIITGVLDSHLDLAHAVARPRIHMQWLPDRVRMEPGAVPAGVQADLEARGHIFETRDPWGNAMAIQCLDDGTRIGVADPREGGGGAAQ